LERKIILAIMPYEDDRAEADMPAGNAAGRPWPRAAGDGIRSLGLHLQSVEPHLNVLAKRDRKDAGSGIWLFGLTPDRPLHQTELSAQAKRKI
jgi:hypothetical protein